MRYISVTYAFTYYFKYAEYYKWTENGDLYNVKTGNKIRKVLNGRCLGYWINKSFYSLSKLKKQKLVIKINKWNKYNNY